MTSKKRRHFISCWVHFLKLRHFKQHFCPNFLHARKNYKNKHNLQRKNVCTFILDAIFVKSKHIQQFCDGFQTFCPNCHRFFPDFKGFWPDFYQIKSYWVVLAPPAPPPPTPVPEHDAWSISLWQGVTFYAFFTLLLHQVSATANYRKTKTTGHPKLLRVNTLI